MGLAEEINLVFAPGPEGNEMLAFDTRTLGADSIPVFKFETEHRSGLFSNNHMEFFLSLFLRNGNGLLLVKRVTNTCCGL